MLRIGSSESLLQLSLAFHGEGVWTERPLTLRDGVAEASAPGVRARLSIRGTLPRLEYTLAFESERPIRVRLCATLPGQQDYFHLIPGLLFGDNNLTRVRPNEFPILGSPVEGDRARAPLWEFRADRAALPVSMLCCARGVAAISIAPYADAEDAAEGFVRTGVFAALPDRFGVSVGYGNDPLTFTDKRVFGPPTCHLTRRTSSTGAIFLFEGADRLAAHRIIRALYGELRSQPCHRRSPAEAIQGLLSSFAEANYSPELGHYTNRSCRVPGDPVLKPWRAVTEIGWTGGGVLAFPFLLSELRQVPVRLPRGGVAILDAIARNRNPRTGFLNETIAPMFPGPLPAHWTDWPRNGWWSGYLPWTENRHCAYTNGNAVYYLLRAALLWRACGRPAPSAWVAAALGVLQTIMSLQRDDGHFGYVYESDRPAVHDWEGFAGAWFAAALPLAWRLTGETRYLESVRRAVACYAAFVRSLCCWGTPMDTWKSPDEEGNLAFLRACRHLHEATGEDQWLEHMTWSADYECLWRYGYRARPEFEPLRSANWNSCGGSLTSVSNPHIHPMGLIATEDLDYLADMTDDAYYRQRAEDGVAWALQTLELYPESMGYGQYGVISERFCPSDGLITETYSDTGRPASTWWSYNAWAAANILEALLLRQDHAQTGAGKMAGCARRRHSSAGTTKSRDNLPRYTE